VSFTLNVYVPGLPPDDDWLAAIARYGLQVRPVGSFSLRGWRGGAAAFAQRGPSDGSELCLELDLGPVDPEELSVLAGQAEPSVAAKLRSARFCASFATPAARSQEDLRLQCFAAAALAALGDGILYDPQDDVFYSGAQAHGAAETILSAYGEEAE
jgi:hypothetical protein